MLLKIKNTTDNYIRADVLLANANPDYSRAALTKLFEMGHITKDKVAIKPGDKIKPNEAIEADISPIEKPAEDIDMPIVYEDDNVIVVNKPVGIISHARGRYWDEPSVASFVRSRVTDISGERAGIVHRLDRATSGVMICAKNPETLSYLQKQFSNRTTKKHYLALIKGSIEPLQGVIDVPIARNTKDPKRFRVHPSGKSAQTQYSIKNTGNGYSLVDLHPKTGRTHQLRIHLAHLNHPIVGDDLYGSGGQDRLMLHAYSLEITIPGGIRKTFTADIPNEFNQYLKDE